VAGSCKYENRARVSIKGEYFNDHQNDHQLTKKDPIPWIYLVIMDIRLWCCG
jgi:hypothetical protein